MSENGKTIVPQKSTYHLNVSIPNGDYVGLFTQKIIIQEEKKIIDTLLIPKIKFTGSAALHSKFWSYFNCDKICNEKEVDYYQNGNKRIEGEFVNGKPKWIAEYRENGTKEFESWYKIGRLNSDRLNKYDDSGQLDEYVITKFRKKSQVNLTYDSKNKLLDRKVIKYSIQK